MNNLYINGIHSLSLFTRPKYFDFHYFINLAYTFADLFCVVFIYDKQTDILVMTFHHFCTITLIVFSYYNHFDSIGSIILYLHNFTDVIVYIGKTQVNSVSYVEDTDFVVEINEVPTTEQLTINCKGQDIEIDAVRLINEDIDSIISDLQIETNLKEKIANIVFSELPLDKKRIEIKKLKKDGLDEKFIKMFRDLLRYTQL